jgi:hypothetical protein
MAPLAFLLVTIFVANIYLVSPLAGHSTSFDLPDADGLPRRGL